MVCISVWQCKARWRRKRIATHLHPVVINKNHRHPTLRAIHLHRFVQRLHGGRANVITN
ncbi:hypothetical protein JB92DRAFT_2851715 [Gautieria morchelliformis]|nr:hypothetical protein JB92DRAFT_2851715 [Gautieria morchelliformis]